MLRKLHGKQVNQLGRGTFRCSPFHGVLTDDDFTTTWLRCSSGNMTVMFCPDAVRITPPGVLGLYGTIKSGIMYGKGRVKEAFW